MDLFRDWPSAYDLHTLNWSGVSAIADVSIVALSIFLLGSVLVALASLKAQNRQSQLEALKFVIQIFESVKDHDHLTRSIGPEFSEWSSEQTEAVRRLSHSLQRAAFLANNGFLDREVLFHMYGGLYVRSWRTMEPYIKNIRREANEGVNIGTGAFSRVDQELFTSYCYDRFGIADDESVNLPKGLRQSSNIFSRYRAYSGPSANEERRKRTVKSIRRGLEIRTGVAKE